MSGLPHPVSRLIVAAALLAGLVACAGSVTGEAQYVGAGPSLTSAPTAEATATAEETATAETTTAEETTAEETAEPTSTAEETTAAPTTTPEETDSDPGDADLTEEEEFACFIVPFADVIADENYGILMDGSDPSVTRESVADDYDDAYTGVLIFLDPLPAGPIRDASEAYADALLDMRDGLRGTGEVTNEAVLQTKTTLLDECGLG